MRITLEFQGRHEKVSIQTRGDEQYVHLYTEGNRTGRAKETLKKSKEILSYNNQLLFLFPVTTYKTIHLHSVDFKLLLQQCPNNDNKRQTLAKIVGGKNADPMYSARI